jgi:hypothetical protein
LILLLVVLRLLGPDLAAFSSSVKPSAFAVDLAGSDFGDFAALARTFSLRLKSEGDGAGVADVDAVDGSAALILDETKVLLHDALFARQAHGTKWTLDANGAEARVAVAEVTSLLISAEE